MIEGGLAPDDGINMAAAANRCEARYELGNAAWNKGEAPLSVRTKCPEITRMVSFLSACTAWGTPAVVKEEVPCDSMLNPAAPVVPSLRFHHPDVP